MADLSLANPLAKYITFAANDCWYSGTAEELIVVYVHSSFLEAHSATSKADNPSWCEATRGKFVDEYWNAIKLEIATLKNIDAWTVIDQGNHNAIASTWASFKCKRYPDELYRSSRHVSVHKVINNSEISFFAVCTCCPVDNNQTNFILILKTLLGLKSKQGDVNVTCAFLCADLEPGENIYVKMPLEFTQY